MVNTNPKPTLGESARLCPRGFLNIYLVKYGLADSPLASFFYVHKRPIGPIDHELRFCKHIAGNRNDDKSYFTTINLMILEMQI